MEGLISPTQTIKQVAFNQVRKLSRIFARCPVAPPSLVATTLDKDDVQLAKEWLKDEDTWDEKKSLADFESAFANWNNSLAAYGFSAGRAALSAAIYSLDLQPGDEVIVPGYTCIVVPNAFKYARITVVYADIELETYGLDIESVHRSITQNTKAILLHHLFGLVCRDYEAIIDLAKKYNIKVIEDCAHATGATYKNRHVGNYGDVAFYSSESSKILNTIQGGIVTTNNEKIATRLAEYAKQAAFPEKKKVRLLLQNVAIQYFRFKHPNRWLLGDVYRMLNAGKELQSTTKGEYAGLQPAHYGTRMPAPIAALGINQLKKLDRYNALRTRGAAYWTAWCNQTNTEKPTVLPESKPAWLRYPVRVSPEKKRNLRWAEKELGILPGVWFLTNLHPAPQKVSGCPNADKAVLECINFPTILEGFSLNIYITDDIEIASSY